jgi:arsenate reductase (glutaredoxin)
MTTVYGIKNCNTVKSALEWLNRNKVSYDFHDYKSKGVTEAMLKKWIREVGWESLLNKRGTTWRQLEERVQRMITSEQTAIDLMKEKTSVIRRPLIEKDGKVIALGFDETDYRKIFL